MTAPESVTINQPQNCTINVTIQFLEVKICSKCKIFNVLLNIVNIKILKMAVLTIVNYVEKLKHKNIFKIIKWKLLNFEINITKISKKKILKIENNINKIIKNK